MLDGFCPPPWSVTIFTIGKKLPWSTDREKFEAWAEGRTGVPFVDANMRELKVNHFSFLKIASDPGEYEQNS